MWVKVQYVFVELLRLNDHLGYKTETHTLLIINKSFVKFVTALEIDGRSSLVLLYTKIGILQWNT